MLNLILAIMGAAVAGYYTDSQTALLVFSATLAYCANADLTYMRKRKRYWTTLYVSIRY